MLLPDDRTDREGPGAARRVGLELLARHVIGLVVSEVARAAGIGVEKCARLLPTGAAPVVRRGHHLTDVHVRVELVELVEVSLARAGRRIDADEEERIRRLC